jgi:hypothetical protein
LWGFETTVPSFIRNRRLNATPGTSPMPALSRAGASARSARATLSAISRGSRSRYSAATFFCSADAFWKKRGRMFGPVCVCVAVIITFCGGTVESFATCSRAAAMKCTGMLVRSQATIAAFSPPLAKTIALACSGSCVPDAGITWNGGRCGTWKGMLAGGVMSTAAWPTRSPSAARAAGHGSVTASAVTATHHRRRRSFFISAP